MNAKAAYKYIVVGIAGSLLILLFSGSGLSQERQRRPRRPPVAPVNLVYDNQIEGIEVPIQETYIRSSDGLYIAAVVLRPDGGGPFPAAILVHGAPGGRGMSALKRTEQTRGMVAERFRKEGYVVIVTDYRGRQVKGKDGPKDFSHASDVVSVIRYAKKLQDVVPAKVCVFSGSLGSETTLLALGEESVAAAVINAPGGYSILSIDREARPFPNPISTSGTDIPSLDMLPDDQFDKEVAHANLSKINSPSLFVVGTADHFLPGVKRMQAILTDLGKEAHIDIYPNERHGFWGGPTKKDGKYEPTPAFSKALEKAVAFFADKTK